VSHDLGRPYGSGPSWVDVPTPSRPAAYQRFPHPVPRRYHRLLRTFAYRWWRPLVGLLLLVVVFLTIGFAVYGGAAIVGVLGGSSAETVFEQVTDLSSPVGLLLGNLALAGAILAAWTAVALAHQERVGWLASVQRRIRWRWLLLNAGLALAVMVPTYLVYFVVPAGEDLPGGADAAWPGAAEFLTLAAIIAVTTPLQAAGEEYAFRGYLSQALGAWLRRPAVPALVSATLFALAHGSQGSWLFADRFAFGLVASWLAWRTGGLEAAIALHAVNNAVALIIAAALGELGQALTLTDIPWTVAAVDIAALLAFAALSGRLAGRRNLPALSQPAEPAVPSLPPPAG
jgi:CAAX protease family protein